MLSKNRPHSIASKCYAAASLLVVASWLCSCTSVRRTYTAGGAPAYTLSCGGFFYDWRGCLNGAGKLCGTRGYDTTFADEVVGTLQISCRAAQ